MLFKYMVGRLWRKRMGKEGKKKKKKEKFVFHGLNVDWMIDWID